MRLVGDLASTGHVDIYHNGHWGSVCDDGWDLDEAQVVCRQMGFSGAIEFTSGKKLFLCLVVLALTDLQRRPEGNSSKRVGWV